MAESQIVYALTNSAMSGLVKIGKTTQEDVSIRMSQLYSTGVPVPFECLYAVEVDDCSKVESALHIAFGPYRINPNREFFKIEPEQAISILELLGPNNATERIANELNQNVSQAEKDSGEKLKKRPNMNYFEMGLNRGDLLYFVDNENITVSIHSEKKVDFNGEIISLTKATKIILGLDYAVQPARKWKYHGRLLIDLYDETYSGEDD